MEGMSCSDRKIHAQECRYPLPSSKAGATKFGNRATGIEALATLVDVEIFFILYWPVRIRARVRVTLNLDLGVT